MNNYRVIIEVAGEVIIDKVWENAESPESVLKMMNYYVELERLPEMGMVEVKVGKAPVRK